MWTPDMSRCPACPEKDDCADRKKILLALSNLTHELNTTAGHVDGPGEGIIIVACHQQH